jgi:hypothetical protein
MFDLGVDSEDVQQILHSASIHIQLMSPVWKDRNDRAKGITSTVASIDRGLSLVDGHDNTSVVNMQASLIRLSELCHKSRMYVHGVSSNSTNHSVCDLVVDSNRWMGVGNIHMVDARHWSVWSEAMQKLNKKENIHVCFLAHDACPAAANAISNCTFKNDVMWNETKVGDTVYVRIPHFSALWCTKEFKDVVDRPLAMAQKMFEIIKRHSPP